MTESQLDVRRERAENGALVVFRVEDGFRVYSIHNPSRMDQVRQDNGRYACTCPDFAAHEADLSWLVKRAAEAHRSKLDNGNSPQEPSISESEKADMEVFLKEIYQTLPLVGLSAFEIPKTVAMPGGQQQKTKNENDTIVVPAQKEGFDRVFLGENAWYAIRISGGMLDKIKYVAAYQTAPISAITHIASVSRIEPYGEEGKYKLIFSEPAKKLEHPIPFGDSPQGFMQGPKYTTIGKLNHALRVADLYN